MDRPAPTNLPPGTVDDTRAGRGAKRVDFEWNGKAYYAEVKPHSWGVEKRALQACSDASGIDPGAFVEFLLRDLVEDASGGLKGVDLIGRDPDFVWTAARALGIMGHLKRIGVKLLSDDAARTTVLDIVHEYLRVEARLRAIGHDVSAIEKLAPAEVERLYVRETLQRDAELERQAAIIGNIIASRLGA